MTDSKIPSMPEDGPVDLTSCDREPIHILGRVQSFGALLAVSSDWIVNHASVNISDFLPSEAKDAIGVPLSTLLSREALHDIRTRLQLLSEPDSVERIFGVRLTQDAALFDLALHLSGRSIVIEIERHVPASRTDYTAYVKPMMERIGKADSADKLCAIAARQLRALIGFDRVMVYKFAEDGAGTVVAESLNGQTESFMGLRYPASDIPKQARALYKRSLLRIIADVSDHGAEIIPAVSPEGQPLDLSMSTTRAVSPIHLEYLVNMGVGASMSISILKRGKLWGLFACHNEKPKGLSFGVRSAAELFGQLFAFVLDQREGDEERADQERAQALHDSLMSQLAEGGTIAENLETVMAGIETVIAFDGAIGWIDGQYSSLGHTPSREEFVGVARFLNTTAASRIFETSNLISLYPEAEAFADRTAGIMVLPVSRTPRDYIVLCRREVANMVNWAGDPNKAVIAGKHGTRLTPRKSFEAWQEVVRNTSSPWTKGERRAGEALRVTLLEVVLRMSDASMRERARAQESQEILIAELNHRVRNILNLIKGLINQSKGDATSIAEFTTVVGGRIHALALAHDQITKENWSPASAQGLIETEAKAYLDSKRDRVNISGPDALLMPTAFTTLSLVMHELMTNAMKYGALCDSRGSIDVTLIEQGDGSLEILWQEKGGPPITTPPTRKGFGSTIIERSISYELEGTAELSYTPTGLKAKFTIPSAFVSEYNNKKLQNSDEAPAQEVAKSKLSGHVLVVEDNIIIAMDAEDFMQSLGAASISMASNAASAIEAITETSFSFALLDVNLGSETSEPVAKLLSEKGVPFAFATGYGDATDVTKRFPEAPVIQKPYALLSIESALSKMKL